MEQEILKSIQEVVDKNLPAQMGESFKKLFDEAKRTKASYDIQLENNSLLTKKVAGLEDKVAEYKKIEEKFYSLLKREEEIEKREKNMDLHDLKKDLVCSEKNFNTVHNLVSQLTRNTVFRETVFENDHIHSNWNSGHEVRTKEGSSKNSTKEAE